MTLSLIVAIILVAAVLFWIFRSSQKEAHHLDDLHITGGKKESKE